jgi:hypothetical protein
MGLPNHGVTVNAGSLLGVADNVHTHELTGETSAAGIPYGVVNWMIKT